MPNAHACTDPHHHVHDAKAFVAAVEHACQERGLRLTPIRARVLQLIAEAALEARDDGVEVAVFAAQLVQAAQQGLSVFQHQFRSILGDRFTRGERIHSPRRLLRG